MEQEQRGAGFDGQLRACFASFFYLYLYLEQLSRVCSALLCSALLCSAIAIAIHPISLYSCGSSSDYQPLAVCFVCVVRVVRLCNPCFLPPLYIV